MNWSLFGMTCRDDATVLLAGITLWAVGGCASTKMRTFTDPDFEGRTYERLLVVAQFPNLDQQVEAEDIFLDELSGLNAECLRSVDVLLPTREYKDEELFDKFQRRGIDAVLVVRETNYYEEEVYIPESSTTTTTANLSATTIYHRRTASTWGSGRATSHATKSGGYYVRKPRVRHCVELYDVDTRRMAWVGAAFTKGSSKARFKHLIESLAEETAETLVEAGFTYEREEGGERDMAVSPTGPSSTHRATRRTSVPKVPTRGLTFWPLPGRSVSARLGSACR